MPPLTTAVPESRVLRECGAKVELAVVHRPDAPAAAALRTVASELHERLASHRSTSSFS